MARPVPLHIVFMGNPEFAVPSLNRLVRSGHHLDTVVTGLDKKRGRGGRKTPSAVKEAAIKARIPLLQTDDVHHPGFVAALRDLKPDLLVVVAFKLLPPPVLSVPRLGSVNLHASLLPRYRGAAPIHWALVNGEKQTGCTIFLLNEAMDAGGILNQVSLPIGLLETTGDVYQRLSTLGAELLCRTIDDLSLGRHTITEQNERLATRAPKVEKSDARIDFEKDCMQVHNLIRGMSPFPGAWTRYENKLVKIFRSRPLTGIQLPAGQVCRIAGEAVAGCAAGAIALEQVQLEGKKKVTGLDFVNALPHEALLSF